MTSRCESGQRRYQGTSVHGSAESSAMKDLGKPGAGKLHARFDERVMPRTRRKERSKSNQPEACRIGDGGRSSDAALQGEASNHLTLRRSRAGVVNSEEKAHHKCVRCEPRRRTQVNHRVRVEINWTTSKPRLPACLGMSLGET